MPKLSVARAVSGLGKLEKVLGVMCGVPDRQNRHGEEDQGQRDPPDGETWRGHLKRLDSVGDIEYRGAEGDRGDTPSLAKGGMAQRGRDDLAPADPRRLLVRPPLARESDRCGGSS